MILSGFNLIRKFTVLFLLLITMNIFASDDVLLIRERKGYDPHNTPWLYGYFDFSTGDFINLPELTDWKIVGTSANADSIVLINRNKLTYIDEKSGIRSIGLEMNMRRVSGLNPSSSGIVSFGFRDNDYKYGLAIIDFNFDVPESRVVIEPAYDSIFTPKINSKGDSIIFSGTMGEKSSYYICDLIENETNIISDLKDGGVLYYEGNKLIASPYLNPNLESVDLDTLSITDLEVPINDGDFSPDLKKIAYSENESFADVYLYDFDQEEKQEVRISDNISSFPKGWIDKEILFKAIEYVTITESK